MTELLPNYSTVYINVVRNYNNKEVTNIDTLQQISKSYNKVIQKLLLRKNRQKYVRVAWYT